MTLWPLSGMPLYLWLHCCQTLHWKKLRRKYLSLTIRATLVDQDTRRVCITLMLYPPSHLRAWTAPDSQPGKLLLHVNHVARRGKVRARPSTSHRDHPGKVRARPPTSHHDRPRLSPSIGIDARSFNIIPQNCRYRHTLPAFQYRNNIQQTQKLFKKWQFYCLNAYLLYKIFKRHIYNWNKTGSSLAPSLFTLPVTYFLFHGRDTKPDS